MVPSEMIGQLAAEAAQQWTGQFNPRPLTVRDFETLYRRAFGES
jgi:alcohol dehydrogenase class IV